MLLEDNGYSSPIRLFHGTRRLASTVVENALGCVYRRRGPGMTISRRTILLAPIAGSLARAQVTTPTPDKAAAASVEEATPLFKTSISLVKVDAKVTTRD